MTVQVNVQEAKTRLSQILAAAERGEDVVIARDGKPVVRLVPVDALTPRELGFVAGSVPEAFFEPLPDDELAAWGVTSLLLDTHALLWALLEPDRLPGSTRARISDAGTELVVSAASAWEIATKHRLGKLDDAEAVVHGYHDHLSRLRARELPISSHHALTAGLLSWQHRDPFDRMITAQAMVESLPLVTADAALTGLPGLRIVW